MASSGNPSSGDAISSFYFYSQGKRLKGKICPSPVSLPSYLLVRGSGCHWQLLLKMQWWTGSWKQSPALPQELQSGSDLNSPSLGRCSPEVQCLPNMQALAGFDPPVSLQLVTSHVKNWGIEKVPWPHSSQKAYFCAQLCQSHGPRDGVLHTALHTLGGELSQSSPYQIGGKKKCHV